MDTFEPYMVTYYFHDEPRDYSVKSREDEDHIALLAHRLGADSTKLSHSETTPAKAWEHLMKNLPTVSEALAHS